jgi:hypothetical protein
MDAARRSAITLHRERAGRERKGVGPPAAAGAGACPRGSRDYTCDGRQRPDGLPGSRHSRYVSDRDADLSRRLRRVLSSRRECELHMGQERTAAGNGAARSEMRSCPHVRTYEFGTQIHKAGDLFGSGFRGPRTSGFPGSLHNRPAALPFAIPNADQCPNQSALADQSAVTCAAQGLTNAGSNSDAVVCERSHVTLLPVTQPDAMPSDSSRSWWIRHWNHRRHRAGGRASDRRTVRYRFEPF